MPIRNDIDPILRSLHSIQPKSHPQRLSEPLHRLLNSFRARRRKRHAEEDIVVSAWLKVRFCSGPASLGDEHAAGDTGLEDLLFDL